MAAELKHTVAPSGGDFTSLAAAVNHLIASHADLVSADVYATIEISGSWSSPDTTGVTVSGITTDATRYVRIYTTGAARHAGVWNSAKYQLAPPDVWPICNQGIQYLYVDGLQLGFADVSGVYAFGGGGTFNAGANETVLSNCIIKGPGTNTNSYNGIYCNKANWNLYVYNTFVYGIGTTASTRCVVNSATGATLTIYNSTLIGGQYGLRQAAGTIVAKNVYAGGAGTACFNGTISMTTCGSSDSTGTSGLQNIPVSTATFMNVTAGSENWHLAGTGSGLYNVGTNTSGDSAPMNFTTDIDGEAR